MRILAAIFSLGLTAAAVAQTAEQVKPPSQAEAPLVERGQLKPKLLEQPKPDAPLVQRGQLKPKIFDQPKPEAAQKKPATRADRLDLDTTVVTGNRELPKVLYIVPWKKAELGDMPAQPFNTLLDEVLAPIDRDVFKREVNYFHAVSQPGAAASAPNGGETR